MAEEERTNESNETNDENDAREEDIVSDTDADTKDEIDTEREHYDDVEKRFSDLESKLDRVLGEISSIREAQGIMVENGAVIQDTDADFDLSDYDSYRSPAELDLLM